MASFPKKTALICRCPLWVISGHFSHPSFMSAFGAKADVNHYGSEGPLLAISGQSYFRHRHPGRRTAFALGAAGGCGGGLRLRHGGPAPGRARSGAGRARSGPGGGIVGGRFPAHTFSNFSDRSQGHTRRGTRGVGLCGGTPPVAVFAHRDAPRKTIDGWLAGVASARAGDVRPAINGRFSASLVTPALPERRSLSERLNKIL